MEENIIRKIFLLVLYKILILLTIGKILIKMMKNQI